MPNESHSKFIQGVVDAFKDLVTFMQKRWPAALLTTIFLIFVAFVVVFFVVFYKNMERSLMILETTHSTPESLQAGLVQSVSENLMIEKELAKIMLGSKNGAAAMFFKFHDSKTDMQGKHDFYYSGMNEIVKDKAVTFLPTTQNIPITGLGPYMSPFLAHKCQTVVTADIQGNTWMKSKFKSENIIRLSSCPIFDISDKYLLGFVELIYMGENDQVRTPEAVEQCLEVSANKISAIISRDIVQ